ncbi:MAG: sugar phosphate isomerase/epimerase [Bryobacteraceae bacterium]|jgi:sugar phosphate isomerase/epimerase
MTTRRELLATLGALAGALGRAAGRLPANRNVKWGLGSNLWNSFKGSKFTDILDVMRDTGFIGLRLTQFPGILQTYGITTEQMEQEVSKRGLHVVTISFNAPAQDASRRKEILDSARTAMTFLKNFGAERLVVFSPNRNAGAAPDAFKTMCECYNQLGELAGEMGFKAGLHNHMGQMVQNEDELDRCMQSTDPKLFWLSPDTAHLHLAGMDSAKILQRYQNRLMLADYKDAKRGPGGFIQNIYDLGDGEVDFPACHRVLKSASLKLWLIVDLDIARNGPRVSYERCGAYVVDKLEAIYV